MLPLLLWAEVLVSGTVLSYIAVVFLNYKGIKRFDQPAVACQLSDEDREFGTLVV